MGGAGEHERERGQREGDEDFHVSEEYARNAAKLTASRLSSPGVSGSPGQTQPAGRVEHTLVFVVAAAAVVAYALPGGAYDDVVRGQFAVGLWWLLGVAAVCGLVPRVRMGAAWWTVAGLGVAFLLLTLIAFTSTASDERTTTELAREVHHLGILVVIALCVRRETFMTAMGGLLTGAVAVCGAAVGSRLAPDLFPIDVVRESGRTNRLSYPLNYWNATGAWGAMTAGIAAALGSHLRRTLARFLAASTVPLCAITAYLAYSRAAVVGVIVAVAVVLLLARNRFTALLHILVAGVGTAAVIAAVRAHEPIAEGTGGGGGGAVALALAVAMVLAGAAASLTARLRADERLRMPARSGRIVAVGLGVAVLAAAIVAGPGMYDQASDSFSQPFGADAADPTQRLASLNGNRHNLYASAIEAGREHGLGGIGPGTFEFWWSADARDPEFVRDAHSLYLEEFAELGWPGLIVILGLVGALAVGGLASWWRMRRERDAVATGVVAAGLASFAVFTVQAGLDWMWESTACAVLGLASAGCALAASRSTLDRGRRPRLRATLAGVALLAVAVQLPPLVSLSRVRASQRAYRAEDPAAARSAAVDAVDAEPWAAAPYVQRGLLEEASGELDKATADVLRAQQVEPTNWRHPLLLARLLAKQDDAKGAIAAYKRARSLRPLSPRFPQR